MDGGQNTRIETKGRNENTMTPIPLIFRRGGYDYKQVMRDDRAAIYRQSRGEESDCFEVVILQKCPTHTWPDGNVTLAHEAMPGSESWGSQGFTCTSLDAAKARFEQITATRPRIEAKNDIHGEEDKAK